MSPSASEIAELNIRHYRSLLRSETDKLKRRTILELLAEEEARLGTLRERSLNHDRLEPAYSSVKDAPLGSS